MKKSILLLGVLALSVSTVFSQTETNTPPPPPPPQPAYAQQVNTPTYTYPKEETKIEIVGFYGYRFGGKVDVFYGGDVGYIKVNDNDVYGLEFNYRIRDRYFVSLQWTRQDSDIDFYGFRDNEILGLGSIATEYFFLSGLSDLGMAQGPIVPFGGAGVGMLVATPDSRELDTAYRFAFTLQGGIKADLSDKIALKFRAAMLAPMQWGSGGLFCSTGSGCNVGVGASTTILQGEVSGGVVVKL